MNWLEIRMKDQSFRITLNIEYCLQNFDYYYYYYYFYWVKWPFLFGDDAMNTLDDYMRYSAVCVCAHVLLFIVAIRIFPHHWMGDALIKEFKLKVKVKCQNVLDIKFIKFWYLHRYIYLCLFLFFSPFSCSLGMPVPVPVIKLREQMLIKSIWIRSVGLAIKIRAMIEYFHMHQYNTTMPILMFNVDCVLTIERQYRVLYSTMMILARFAHTNKMTKTILLFVFPVSL